MSIKGQDCTPTRWPNVLRQAAVVDPNKYYPLKREFGSDKFTIIGEVGIQQLLLSIDPNRPKATIIIADKDELLAENFSPKVLQGLVNTYTPEECDNYIRNLIFKGYILVNPYISKNDNPQLFAQLEEIYESYIQLVLNQFTDEPQLGKYITDLRLQKERERKFTF